MPILDMVTNRTILEWRRNQGKAKAMSADPAATARYCLPPMAKLTGGATIEPPV